MGRLAGKVGVGQIGTGEERMAVAEYSFAVDGGAVSAIPLRSDKVPSGAIIVDSLIVVDTVVTGPGASVAVAVESAGDVVAAAAISGTPWSTATAKRGAITRATVPVRTTAERTITATISAAVLTAGRFRVVLSYIEMAP